jgi:hypothetical protein
MSENLFLCVVLFISVDLHVCSQLTFDNDHNVFAIVVISILHMLPCFSAEGGNADSLLQLLNIMRLTRNNMTDCCPLQILVIQGYRNAKKKIVAKCGNLNMKYLPVRNPKTL